jgi:hypothetical protein
MPITIVVATTLTAAIGTKTQIGVVSLVDKNDYDKISSQGPFGHGFSKLTDAKVSGKNMVATTDNRRELCAS